MICCVGTFPCRKEVRTNDIVVWLVLVEQMTWICQYLLWKEFRKDARNLFSYGHGIRFHVNMLRFIQTQVRLHAVITWQGSKSFKGIEVMYNISPAEISFDSCGFVTCMPCRVSIYLKQNIPRLVQSSNYLFGFADMIFWK